MAAFYIDHDVAVALAPVLRVFGHEATLTDDLGLTQASDGRQLLTAAEHDWVLVTHNRRDFIVLHDAWRCWTAAWRVQLDHAGIVVVPRSVRGETWLPVTIAQRLNELVGSDEFSAGQLFTWSREARVWEGRTREP